MSEKPTEWDCFGNNLPKCPHCGYDEQDVSDFDMHDGENLEHLCGRCEKPYEITLWVSYSYKTKPIGGWANDTD